MIIETYERVLLDTVQKSFDEFPREMINRNWLALQSSLLNDADSFVSGTPGVPIEIQYDNGSHTLLSNGPDIKSFIILLISLKETFYKE